VQHNNLQTKTALRYGLPITLVVVVWVVATRFLFSISPDSTVNMLAPIPFNLAAIIAIYLGIKATSRQRELNFREGVRIGFSISLVYAISTCLFFFILFLIIGPALMANEPTAQTYPTWQVALVAFSGMFVGAVVLGLFYSTIISFLLVRSRRG
jgi:hypothetical protein